MKLIVMHKKSNDLMFNRLFYVFGSQNLKYLFVSISFIKKQNIQFTNLILFKLLVLIALIIGYSLIFYTFLSFYKFENRRMFTL